jgi:CheY-like chemotaxis protein
MPTVLIVDDDKNISQLIAIHLRNRGYNTLEAQAVQAGLDLLKRHGPQLLVLNIRLPGASGWDMLKLIDSDQELPKLPVVIMTASVLGLVDEYAYPNIVGRLTKPFEANELLNLAYLYIGR